MFIFQEVLNDLALILGGHERLAVANIRGDSDLSLGEELRRAYCRWEILLLHGELFGAWSYQWHGLVSFESLEGPRLARVPASSGLLNLCNVSILHATDFVDRLNCSSCFPFPLTLLADL